MSKNLLFLLPFCVWMSACSKKSIAEVDNESHSAIDYSTQSRGVMALLSGIHQALIYTPGTGANQTKVAPLPCYTLVKVSGDTLWGKAGHINPTYSISISALTACNPEILDAGRQNQIGDLFITLTDKLQTIGAITIIKGNAAWIKAYGEAYTDERYKFCDSMVLKTTASDANMAKFDLAIVNAKRIQDINGNFSLMNANFKLSSTSAGTNDPFLSFYGAASGTNSAGLSYTVNIGESSPIIKSKTCYYYKSGIAELIPSGFKSRNIDFGNGNCDDDAKMTVNGNTIAFKLK